MSLNSGTRLGPYEVTGSLGAGGMGEVYRAVDTRLKRAVALKIKAGSDDGTPTPRKLIVVEHWFEELKRLVPTK